jgi:hypothetical protein
MFEFHGWVSIAVDDGDDGGMAVLAERLDDAISAVAARIAQAEDGLSVFEVRRAGNGLAYVAAHGLRNRRYAPVFALFEWIAANLPESYGLLHVRDDEDDRGGGADYSNAFRVWRVARGEFAEHADTLLSPCVPTIEAP